MGRAAAHPPAAARRNRWAPGRLGEVDTLSDRCAPIVVGTGRFLMVPDTCVMNVSISRPVEDFDTEVTTIQAVIALYAPVMARAEPEEAQVSRTTGPGPVTGRADRAGRRAHADYTGGVYGSLLAASVVVGAGSLGSFPRAELVLLLLLTGVVFWIAHVHAQLFGARLARRTALDRGTVLRVCRDEWPIVNAAVPPAAAVALSPLLGLDVKGAVWLALSVAVAGQVGWSVAAARRVGAPRRLMAGTALVNLVLGLLIITFKIVLKH